LKVTIRNGLRLNVKVSPDSSRMRLVNQCLPVSGRTYRCDICGTQIHIDVDWEEGAEVEPTATFK
jgi:hypothetical protein